MSILFINQSPSHLTKDIINAFADKYERVSLIAGRITESGNPLNNRVKISRVVKI